MMCQHLKVVKINQNHIQPPCAPGGSSVCAVINPKRGVADVISPLTPLLTSNWSVWLAGLIIIFVGEFTGNDPDLMVVFWKRPQGFRIFFSLSSIDKTDNPQFFYAEVELQMIGAPWLTENMYHGLNSTMLGRLKTHEGNAVQVKHVFFAS